MVSVGRSAVAGTRRRPPMVNTFLVPPVSFLDWVADGIRLVGVVSFVVVCIGWGGVFAAMLALALLGLVTPRFLGLRPCVDIATGIAVLIAAWCSVLDLYRTYPSIDIPIHLVLDGLLALLAVVAAARGGVLQDRRTPVLFLTTLTVGLALGALWEMGEWVGNRLDEAVLVGYDDSILDMTVGGLGAGLAGLLVPAALRRGRWQGRDDSAL